MSDMGALGSVISAPGTGPSLVGDSVAVPEAEVDGDFSFDRSAALEEATAKLRGEESSAEEVEAEAAPEKAAEDQTDEARETTRRKKLSDEEGKLSQDKLDNAFAKLTAQNKRLAAQRAEFNQQKTAFETAKAEYDSAIEKAATRVTGTEKEFEERRTRAKTDPLAAFEELGWDVPRLVEFIKSDGKVAPEQQIKETRSEYDKRFEMQQKELEQLRNDLKNRDFKAAASQYEAKATKAMADLMPNYEFISKYDLNTEVAPKVLQNIAHIYREGGEINGVKYPKGTALDPKIVLDYFEAQTAKEVARFGVRPGQAGAAKSAAKPGAVQPKTLSNADTSSRGMKPSDDDSSFDREEAMREATRMLHG